MLKNLIKTVGKKIKNLAGPDKKEAKESGSATPQEAVAETRPPEPSLQTQSGEAEAAPVKRKRRRRRKKKRPAEQPPVQEQPTTQEESSWSLEEFQVAPEEGKSRFHDFDLPLEIMHAVAEAGFQYCTPIQAMALPECLPGHDCIGRAQTGTGKSAAFLITILNRLLTHAPKGERQPGSPRALIIAPTRELVMQIIKDAKVLGKFSSLNTVSVFGGVDYQKQKEDLQSSTVDLMAATPGRLLDYLRQRVVHLDKVEILVLDEADRMLDMGFIPDVRRIVHHTPAKEKRQTMLFSATITEDVKRLAAQWCVNPVSIEVEPEQVTVDTVEQLVYLTTAKEKYAVLYNILTQQKLERVLVFTNRKDEARKLTDRLKRNKINCTMLSGDVNQQQRMSRLEGFRAGRIKVLVATDVAGRGIHIDGVSHVVNYTLPYEPEDYVHRIGRTGRAGAAGISISFACDEGAFYLPDIEEYIGRKLECMPPEESLLTPPPKGTAQPQKEGGQRRHGSGGRRGGGSGKRRPPRRRSGSGGQRSGAGK